MSDFLMKLLEFSDEVSTACTETMNSFAYLETSMKKLFSSGISAREFQKLYNTCSYDFFNKRLDVKILKNNDILGVYVLYNKNRNTYFVGHANRVFRKVDRQFRGFENEKVFRQFSDGEEYYVKIIPFKEGEYTNLVEMEKEVRGMYGLKNDNHIKSEREFFNESSNGIPVENDNVNVKSRTHDIELKRKRRKAFFFNRKKIEVSYNTEELVGKNVDVVYSFLENVGFNKVKMVPVKEIDAITKKAVGEVKSVVIDKISSFQRLDKFAYDAPINIFYYDKREICMPHSYKYYKKRNYQDVCKELRNMGFVNVTCIKQNDLIIGYLKREDNIARISIDNNTVFSKKNIFTYDVDIKIWFHAFK